MSDEKAWTRRDEQVLAEVKRLTSTLERSPWYDCAKDLQIASRTISEKYGVDYVAAILPAVAERTGAGINTLRRYLALLEFVDRKMLNDRSEPAEETLYFIRTNFSGLEKISRIEKMNPSEAEALLKKLRNGETTTRDLEDFLKDERSKNPASITSRRGQAISSRMKELNTLEKDLGSYLRNQEPGGSFAKVLGPSFLRVHWLYAGAGNDIPTGYFASAATSDSGFEQAFIDAVFTSRFFENFYLVMPFSTPTMLRMLQQMNVECQSGVGLLHYSRRTFERKWRSTPPPFRLLRPRFESRELKESNEETSSSKSHSSK
jgi:hypothetical protein